MKVTLNRIDRELRTRGLLLDVLVSKSSEAQYTRSMKRTNKLSKYMKGKKAKGMDFSEEWLTRPDGTKLRLCVYKPIHIKGNLPAVLWLHGGGYAQGIPEMFSRTYKKLIETRDCIIIAPDYRLSIEAPYPAALEDAYASIFWMKNQAQRIGIKSSQLMVGGESSGGGLTAALTLYARDKGEVNIAFQMPLYPMIDDRGITESSTGNTAPIWNSKTNNWAWKLYLGELYGTEVSPYAAPARATNYHRLPPTVSFVGDVEPFRDETIEYIKRLKRAGVPTGFRLFRGAYHGFDIVAPNAALSKEAAAFLISQFKYAVDHYTAEQFKPMINQQESASG